LVVKFSYRLFKDLGSVCALLEASKCYVRLDLAAVWPAGAEKICHRDSNSAFQSVNVLPFE